jgi:FMN phosphatase YigB (HAD superfamily)
MVVRTYVLVGRLGLRVGIVGNQTEAMERWAREAVLPADLISSSASLGVRKPDPRFFARVVELAGCRSQETAYVGDRVDNDVLPAAAAGLVAVHVRRGPWGRLQPTPPEAALAVDDLAALPHALASLR